MSPICESATKPGTRPTHGWLSTRTQIILGSCACAGATAFLYAVDPNRHSVYPQCLLYKMTGIYCAGCGATRAAYALLHGRVIDALHDNAIFVAALPFILFFAATSVVTAWRGNTWPPINIDPRGVARWGTLLLIVAICYTALRNLPGWPFEWLRPLGG